MPWAAQKPCMKPGCARLSDGGLCPTHRRARARAYDAERGSAASRGYGPRWRKARKAYLAAHPLCAAHGARGETAAATVVDHMVPHRGDKKLFWNSANWQPLCKPCHDAKTAREDGGWGRRAAAHHDHRQGGGGS